MIWLIRVGGAVAGVGVSVAVYHVMATRAAFGIPALWLFTAAATALLAAIPLKAVRPRTRRSFLRSTALITGGLFGFISFVGWEGHLGGYWEAARMDTALRELREVQTSSLAATGELVAVAPERYRSVGTLEVVVTPLEWTAWLTNPASGRRCVVVVQMVEPARNERRPECHPASLSLRTLALATILLLTGAAVGPLAARRLRTYDLVE